MEGIITTINQSHNFFQYKRSRKYKKKFYATYGGMIKAISITYEFDFIP